MSMKNVASTKKLNWFFGITNTTTYHNLKLLTARQSKFRNECEQEQNPPHINSEELVKKFKGDREHFI